jgi:hypothetical protein
VGRPRNVVEIRRTADGRLLRSIVLSGTRRAVALTPTRLAVLVARNGAASIDVHTRTGRRLRSVAVEPGARHLSMSGTRAVFAAGRRVESLDVRTGAVRIVARTAAPPINRTIDGRRVAWPEDRLRAPDVIRLAALPG